MPQPRKLDPTTLLFWDAQRVTTVEMQRRLAAQGTTASVDLIRLRLREARRNAQGKPPAPRPQRKSSATARRQGQLAEAVKLLSDLQADLEGVVSGWGEDFVKTGRYQRFDEAAQALQEIVVLLEDLNIGWGEGSMASSVRNQAAIPLSGRSPPPEALSGGAWSGTPALTAGSSDGNDQQGRGIWLWRRGDHQPPDPVWTRRFSLGGDRPLIQDHRAEPAWEQGASIPDSVPGRELR